MPPLRPGTKLPPQKERRNERERNRVNKMNAQYDILRNVLRHDNEKRKLSKVDTVRAAIRYIEELMTVLKEPVDSAQPHQYPAYNSPAPVYSPQYPTSSADENYGLYQTQPCFYPPHTMHQPPVQHTWPIERSEQYANFSPSSSSSSANSSFEHQQQQLTPAPQQFHY